MTNPTPGEGHNSKAEAEAFERALRLQIALNAERASLNAKISQARKRMKADGITLADLDATIRMLEWTPAEVREQFDRAQRYAMLAGLPVGTQLDLLSHCGDPEVAAADWFAVGRAAGLLGKDGVPPKTVPPEHHQDWMEGWTDGQGENAPKQLIEKDEAA